MPLPGTVWKGPPCACDSDAIVTHVHGTANRVVPIGGRRTCPTRQGDIATAIAFYVANRRLTGTMRTPSPDGLICARWDGDADAMPEHCTHGGGQRCSIDYIRRIWLRQLG
ncbi:hypothetical protein SAMN05444004_102224 [Jannaschia faecimaris]|uniref:Uncharacterized protein n=1 Tax=Jannaschia faecimaris TaxID=1244108 RepID=A0A1H3LKR4_9RHOB|nr:hypothetical protein [Jannaschia faecimaris]SDY64445.1 hypothetical protein SAMN05444004_102224 [Jannaschia faecimaris]